jgi:hypothetical protein
MHILLLRYTMMKIKDGKNREKRNYSLFIRIVPSKSHHMMQARTVGVVRKEIYRLRVYNTMPLFPVAETANK